MSYVPGYDYDFFVSYARVDNDPVPSADCGWITTLIGILTSGSGLAGKLGRGEALRQWMDDQNLRGNQEAEGHIPEQVKRSALFLVVQVAGLRRVPVLSAGAGDVPQERRHFLRAVVRHLQGTAGREPAPDAGGGAPPPQIQVL
jgi:hypothetical protein